MDKDEVAAILEEMGTILEVQGENAFRCQAYHNAARALRQFEGELQPLVAAGELDSIPGVGKTLAEKIATLVTTGQLAFYEEIKRQAPPGLIELLRLPGLGPKKVKAVHEQLGVRDLQELQKACEANRVAGLKGFGERTQAKILAGIRFLAEAGEGLRLDQAEELSAVIIDALRGVPGLLRLEVCGSLRRRKETVKDLDFLASADDAETVVSSFTKLPGVAEILARGPTKSSVVLKHYVDGGRTCRINADLRVVRDEEFACALHYFTGSKEHNVAMRARAQSRGLKLNEYSLSGPGAAQECPDEASLFRALDLEPIPPELREHTGELEAASRRQVPCLIESHQLRGTFHCHTDWSDGNATLAEMAESARARGWQYLGIADHSQSLTIARGLTPDRVRQQQVEIDALNKRFRDFRLLKGIECDILVNGQLDFDEDVLASFDYVVASVHSRFDMPQDAMTARIIRAVRHPRVTMLGHPTGRLLLRRQGYRVDLEAVLQAAAESGTFVEINSDPSRLDLDWLHCKRAKALGVKLVINPDAHSTAGLGLVRYGIDVARRGWLQSTDVVNTLTTGDVLKAISSKRPAGA